MDRTRRTFLGTAVGVAATAGLGTTAASAAGSRRRRIPPSGIGMHLYTMRTPLATDFRGTLERLAEIGYATVGVSGRHGHSAADVRRMLDGTRLRAVLEHVGYDIVKGAGLPQALEDIHTLGGKWIVVPSLPGSLHSPAGYREVAREFNRIGLAARESGLKLLYHNHGTDHQVVDGVSLYGILLAETDPELVGFELDLYWAANGGASAPGELFVRHPRRFPALHVKDMAPNGDFADVGSGVLDFPAMFDTARRGGVKQWLVEHDAPADPFASALASYTYLSRLRY
ncbi:sugar phosphate isomerase/epimerase [Streptomyces sp. NBC_01591]|uniref:sugar phosphate isomerase/epimerase family protein n=1 Tax=Streptomyces sp. NBC_01591 TaxID=2975888 RepID=UPI002DDA3CAE|nr:sugar phosphate isomerase/epimerase [Streptomyces sp. NBC_01591]WSD72367.1 sugar phosphate isomerase/epimerase [Streptomyces sp. NBC_01591]